MCDELELYVLNGLSEDERARFEVHLDQCAQCQQELPHLIAVTTSLALTADPITPPARLKMRVLTATADVPKRFNDSDNIVPLGGRRKTIASFSLGALAAALVAIFVLVSPSAPPASVTDRSPEVVLAAVNKSPDAASVRHSIEGGGAMKIIYSSALNQAVATYTQMPPLTHNEVYELWLQDSSGKLHAAGILPPSRSGVTTLAGDVAHSSRAAVTVEASPGATVPTTIPLASLEL